MMGGRRPERHQRARMVVVKTPSEGKPSMGKSIRNFATVTRVGLDLAKRVFQVHAVDAKREIVVRAQAHARPAHPVFRRAAAVCGGDGGVRLGASLGAGADRTWARSEAHSARACEALR